MAYAEWCAPQDSCASVGCDHALDTPGCALDNVAFWHMANPTLGKRMTVAHITAERRAMPPEEFGRERLGWWDEASGQMVVPPAAWASCLDLKSQIASAPCFALDVSPARSWAAIGVAGIRADGLPHIEVTSSKGVVDHRPGVEWAVPRLLELRERWPGMTLTIASGSAAESLVPALVQAGLDLIFVKAGDVAAACGMVYDKATTQGLRHIGQSELTMALECARKNIDDGEGAWRWGRKKSGEDITTLYAATLALWSAIAALDKSMDPANNFW